MADVKFNLQGDARSAVLAIERVEKAFGRVGKSVEKTAKPLNLLSTAVKGFIGLQTARFAARFGQDMVKLAADAEETRNLFAVSFGSMASQAEEWAQRTSKALGLNAINVQRNLGVMFSMTTSMGLSRDQAFEMAKGIAQLSEDMASFFNLDPEEAFIKLQAGISGETEPLKRLGILVDEATTKQTAYSLGIAKFGTQLTQQQKVLARYETIMRQTANAQGDLARTLDSPANKMRRFAAQVDELKLKIGELLLPAADRLVTWLSTVVEQLDKILERAKEVPGAMRGFVETFEKVAGVGASIAGFPADLLGGILGIDKPGLGSSKLLEGAKKLFLIQEQVVDGWVGASAQLGKVAAAQSRVVELTAEELALREKIRREQEKQKEILADAIRDVETERARRKDIAREVEFGTLGMAKWSALAEMAASAAEREARERQRIREFTGPAQARKFEVGISAPPSAGASAPNVDVLDPRTGVEGLTTIRTKMEEEAGLLQNIAGIIGGVGANMFAELGAGFRTGGLNAAAILQGAFGAILSSIGSALIGQGIAEIIMGTAPPPFGPRPDLVTHGGIMTAIGSGLSIGGGFIGAGASGGGSANSQIAESPFRPVSVIPTADIGSGTASAAGAPQQGVGAFDQLVGVVSALDAKISSMPAGHVVVKASRGNRRLLPSLSFGEVPA